MRGSGDVAVSAAELVARAEGLTAPGDVAREGPALDDAIVALEAAGPEERPWLRRALAVRARWSLLAGDRDGAARAVRRLDELSRGGQDRWFAATARLFECELLLADGFATAAARKLDGLARWCLARSEAPVGLTRAVLASRVLAHLAAGQVDALAGAAAELERAAAGEPLVALARGCVREHAGDVDGARDEYRRALSGTAVCALEAHLALARMGDGAADHLAAAAALAGGDHPRVLAIRAQAELAAGRYAQALALTRRLQTTPTGEALAVCAEVACAVGTDDARARITLLGLWAHEHGAASLEAHAYLLAARIATDPIERATSIRRAREIAGEHGDALVSLRARLEQARLELDLGHADVALASAIDVESAALGRRREDLVAAAALVRGLALAALGRPGSDVHLRRAGELALAHGQISIAARALIALGRVPEAHNLCLEAGLAS